MAKRRRKKVNFSETLENSKVVNRTQGEVFSSNLGTGMIEAGAPSETCHEEIRFSCNQCEFTSVNSEHLQEHISSVHEKTKFACEQCDFEFEQKEDVIKHVKLKHNVIEPEKNKNSPSTVVEDRESDCDDELVHLVELTEVTEILAENIKENKNAARDQRSREFR